VKGNMNVIMTNNNIIEQLHSFNYLRYTIRVTNNRDLDIKMNRFNKMRSTIRTLNKKARKDIQITFYILQTVLSSAI
jgi:hypothetical protein